MSAGPQEGPRPAQKAPAGVKPQAGGAAVSLRPAGGAPVSAALTARLAADKGPVNMLVRLRAQADTRSVVEAALETPVRSAGRGRVAAREAVVGALQDTARHSQGTVGRVLQQLQAKGAVESYRPFWIVNGFAIRGTAAAAAVLASLPEVASVDLDAPVYLLAGATPAGAAAAGAGDEGEWNVQRIGAPAAWALGVDGTGAVVGSIDTGVDWSHPAIRERFRGYDPANPDTPVAAGNWFDAVNGQDLPYDDNGHGTHVTGTMVGQAADAIIGVAPGARWIAAKAFTAGGSGSASALLAAAEWMLAPTDAAGNPHPEWAPDVVNNSWGGGPGLDEWFRPMVEAWRAAGIVPVFANGNEGPADGTASTPGNYPESLAVGATDRADLVASFSSRGPSPYGEIKPDISAPGVGIRSAIPGGGYAGSSGTSMAAPHVAGAVALLVSANNSLTVDAIEDLLLSTAQPLTDTRYPDTPNNGYGYGMLSAFDAVAEVIGGRGVLAGRVVESGDDLDAPVIDHVPATEAFAGFPLPVSADIGDNVGVAEANVLARRAGERYYTVIPMQRVAGDHRSGTYQAEIPGELVLPPDTEYYIEARDRSGNIATHPADATRPHHVAVSLGVRPGYRQDFEQMPAGWIHGGVNDPWQWGEPGAGVGAFSGTRVYATNLSGNYPNDANAYLMMPPVDLTEGRGAVLRWQHWYDLETGYDFGDVWATVDGVNWDHLVAVNGRSEEWQAAQVDLTPYAGQVVVVVFNLVTDYSVTRLGWYIDDVEVLGGDETPPAPPTNLTLEPGSSGEVLMVWTAPPDPDLAGFHVSRRVAGGDWAVIATTDADMPAYIDNTAPAGTAVTYRVTAFDVWGNEGDPSAEATATTAAVAVAFLDALEDEPPGVWTLGGTNSAWQMGTPDFVDGPRRAYSFAAVWGTNLTGPYGNNANAWIMTPPIDLTGYSEASLRFANWHNLESGWDYGLVEISTDDGATWTALTQYTGISPGWVQADINISDYAGATVRLRFRHTSDGSVVRPGWYIDDVKVVGAVGAASIQPDGAITLSAPKRKPAPRALTLKLGAGGKLPLPQGGRTPAAKPGPAGAPQTGAAPAGEAGLLALPVDATVTVVETGRSVRTDPATGAYRLSHAAGTWLAVAEAYGFYPTEQPVTISDGATTTAHFYLQPMPRGTISGTVTDARTGEPLAGVRLWVSEDVRVAPVVTDGDGHYSLTVLAGDYTLHATAPDYYPDSAAVSVPGGETVIVDLSLQPFVGMPGEIGYDDGSPDNAWAYYEAGNGWAVRFSLPAGQGMAQIRGAKFLFWDTSWPEPGGTEFQVEVWDASGSGGAPGHRLGGPVTATARRDGTWTTVDLSHLGLSAAGDFYVAYIQAREFPDVPGLAVDLTPPLDGRSWSYIGGTWSPADPSEGDRMIRALVAFEVPAPDITAPADETYTAAATVDVSGRALDGTTVTLYRDGVPVAAVPAAGGSFTAEVALAEGLNVLTAVAATPDGRTTAPSAPVRVYRDGTAPQLTVTAPADGSHTNREVVTVTGRASDNLALAGVTVSGQAVTVEADGSFQHRLLLDPGANVITIVASDRAGNAVSEVRTVHMNSSGPEIRNPQPAEDVVLLTGDSVTIRFESDPGLEAAYVLTLPGTGTRSLVGTPMPEVSPGVYEAVYTAPAGTSFTDAGVLLQAADGFGNEIQLLAPGRITVANNQRPVAVIADPVGSPVPGRRLIFDGLQSYDPDGRIVSYVWDFGDGSEPVEGSRVRHHYTAAGTYTVSLTVTDNLGATDTDTYELVIGG